MAGEQTARAPRVALPMLSMWWRTIGTMRLAQRVRVPQPPQRAVGELRSHLSVVAVPGPRVEMQQSVPPAPRDPRLAEIVEERRKAHAQRHARVGGRLDDPEGVLVDGKVVVPAVLVEADRRLELGQHRDEHARVAGEPSALRGLRAEQQLGSSPIPSAASPPPIRSRRDEPHGRRPPRASARSVRSSGSRSSCDTSRSPRTSRSGSSAKLRGETVRSTPRFRSPRPSNGSTSVAVAEPPRDRVDGEVAARAGRPRPRVGVDDDLEVVAAGPGRALARAAARTRSRPARARGPRGRAGRAGAPTGRPRDDEVLDPAVRLERRAQALGVEAERRGSPHPSSRARAARRARRRRRGRRRARATRRSPRSLSCAAFVAASRAAAATASGGSAIASISTSAPDGSFATSTVERAGGGRRRAARRPRSSRRSRRGSEEDRRLDEPVERRARGLEDRAQVRERPARSARRSRRRRAPVAPGRRASWPETKTNPSGLDRLRVRRALERRGRRLRAHDVLAHATPSLHCWCVRRPTRLPERGAERLEDRLEHVLRVLALEQPDVDVSPAPPASSSQESRDDVAREPADALAARSRRSRPRAAARRSRARRAASASSAGRQRPAAPGAPVGAERLRERAPERAARGRDLLARRSRLDLERDAQPPQRGQRAEQVVEHRQAGRDARRAVGRELDADARLRPAMRPSVHGCRRGSARRLGDRRARSTRRARADARRSARSPGRSGTTLPIVEVPSAQSARDQQRHPGADVGARHALPVELRRADHDDAVRVAEDDPRAHRDELVDEERGGSRTSSRGSGSSPRACVATATAIDVRSAGNAGHGPSSIFGES